jgi:hypothetical protein
MNETRPDEGESGSWTSETLPLHVRRQLLERELKKMGFRKESHASHGGPVAQQQQQPQGAPSSHPMAGHGDTGAGEHGD